MAERQHFATLNSQEWDRVQSIADTFENAWQKGNTVELVRYLPPEGDPLRRVVLHELIKSELEIRWRSNRGLPLEYYLGAFPEVGTGDTIPVTLIYEEYRVRTNYGDRPSLESYRVRFPAQYPELQALAQREPVQPQTDEPPAAEKRDEPSAVDQFKTVNVPTPPPPPAPVPKPVPPPISPPKPEGKNLPVTPRPRETRRPSNHRTASEQTLSKIVMPEGEGYELVRRLGRGSFAEVWEARSPGGVLVAVKRILAPMDKEEAEREKRSLEITKNIRHHYLLLTQNFFVMDDQLYIVMELADGTLRDRLKYWRKQGEKGIPIGELIRYMEEAAEAIDFLHKNKILHRDLKPENILYSGKHVKVADFGLAKIMQSHRLSMTGGGGTPRYMAPEVWDAKLAKTGEQTDQYALAATYVELRCGQPAFSQVDMVALMLAHLKDPPELSHLTEPEREVIGRSLSKHPKERYLSCTEMVQQLRKAVTPELMKTNPEFVSITPHERSVESQNSSSGEKTPVIWSTVQLRQDLLRYALPFLFVVAMLFIAVVLVWRFFFTAPPFALSLSDSQKSASAGSAFSCEVKVAGNRSSQALDLAVETPSGVVATVEQNAATTDTIPVRIVVTPDAEPGKYEIRFKAQQGDETKETVLRLTVEKKLAYYLPLGWRPHENAPYAEHGDHVFYKQIVVTREKVAVVFHLIPPDEAHDMKPFYITRDKVSIADYAHFSDSPNTGTGSPIFSKWRENQPGKENPDDRRPVMVPSATDAHLYAAWMVGAQRGFLPTAKQWDKASGRFDRRPDQEGPYRGTWIVGENDLAKQPKIAVCRNREEPPLPCGEAADDVCDFSGLRDMAGNGYEWVRNLRPVDPPDEKLTDETKRVIQEQKLLPLPEGIETKHFEVERRGQAITNRAPYQYIYYESNITILGKPPHGQLSSENYDTGFRVVIEVLP